MANYLYIGIYLFAHICIIMVLRSERLCIAYGVIEHFYLTAHMIDTRALKCISTAKGREN